MNVSGPNPHSRPPGYARHGELKNPRKLLYQDFDSLREAHLQKGTLFIDEAFPPDINSIGSKLVTELSIQKITWRRPQEICKRPQLIVNGTSIFDIVQKNLGNCWFLCAMGSLTLQPQLLNNNMPGNQDFGDKYAGIFHFRLWHLGEWVDIVIDDMLPFVNGDFLSVKPNCENEFWPCLLEKAYAKLLGCYYNLHWGIPAEAFVNLTGQLAMSFDLKSSRLHVNDLWNMISTASRDALMACISAKQEKTPRSRSYSVPSEHETIDVRRNSVPANEAADIQRSNISINRPPENIFTNKGLVERHAYCITNARQVQLKNGQLHRLIRLWNPWGQGEWAGAWNDRSPFWNLLIDEDRKLLQTVREDGEFWMPWEDFAQDFSTVILCNHIPDFLDLGDQHRKWYRKPFWKRWRNVGSTGKFNDEELFLQNPQYIISVTSSDEVKRGFNIVITLMQSSRNQQKFGSWLSMGFALFKVDPKRSKSLLREVSIRLTLVPTWITNQRPGIGLGFSRHQLVSLLVLLIMYIFFPFIIQFQSSNKKLPASFFTSEKLADLQAFRMRDLTSEFNLSAGTYIIIPYIRETEKEASLLLQIFLKSRDSVRELGLAENSKPSEEQTNDHVFKRYATKGNVMHCWELQRWLNEEFTKESPYQNRINFTLDGSREMLTSVDYSGRGKLESEDFNRLWRYLTRFTYSGRGKLESEDFNRLWRYLTRFTGVFADIDRNGSGFLDPVEFCKAVKLADLNASSDLLGPLIARYENSEEKLAFVDCLTCMMRLKAALKTFYWLSVDGKGVYLTQDKWMKMMV
ncbi:calpain-13-like [Hyperolius riggenbachi]|uniref:calpain-13-like n=1 Tax=Hyperolius riggenbachi TaxID=752182 RepID=UPI0035A3039C